MIFRQGAGRVATLTAAEGPRPHVFRLVSTRGDELARSADLLLCLEHLRQSPRGGRVVDEYGTIHAKRLTVSQAMRLADEETQEPEDADG
jgi:hypothetical protein